MLDHEALHELFWLRSGSGGVLRINQSRLAEDLVTTRLVVHRALERMVTDGRIVKLAGASGPSTRSYEIIDPAVWRERSAPR